MRVFSIWREIPGAAVIDGASIPLTCRGGSNASEEDAVADGQRRLSAVLQRIAGELAPDAPYEADIVEEPLHWLGERDVVTRNRHGVEVLNATSCVIIDIDQPVVGFWAGLFGRGPRTAAQRKAQLRDFLAKRLAERDLEGCPVRIYETPRGWRVILGRRLDPRSDECQDLLHSFRADNLYAILCRKQNCFRARLTPKPYRIGLRSAKIKFPHPAADADRIAAWVEQYDRQRTSHAACRLIQATGREQDSPVIAYHDQRSGALSQLPLA